jgi:hypothetical protein
MITILKELLVLLACLYLFLVLRSHYSKGESFKDAFFNNVHYVVMVLFSPVTWFAIFVAAIYVAYQIIH